LCLKSARYIGYHHSFLRSLSKSMKEAANTPAGDKAMALTKSELIERIVAKQTLLTAKDVELAVKTIVEQMSESLSTGGRIEIRGFGSFPCITASRASAVIPRPVKP